jgi:hypothetical protein
VNATNNNEDPVFQNLKRRPLPFSEGIGLHVVLRLQIVNEEEIKGIPVFIVINAAESVLARPRIPIICCSFGRISNMKKTFSASPPQRANGNCSNGLSPRKVTRGAAPRIGAIASW